MKSFGRIIVASLAVALLGTEVRAADTQHDTNQIVRASLRADKKALVATNLGLTKTEGEKFWPIYDQYQKELFDVQTQLFEVIEEYASTLDNMTDESAKDMTERYLAAEEQRAKIRRNYFAPMSAAIPGMKVARFYQIENKIDAEVRYEMAAVIPLVKP